MIFKSCQSKNHKNHSSDIHASLNCPFNHLWITSLGGAESFWMGADASTHQIQPIGVPAGADGDILMAFPVGVTSGRNAEQINFMRGQIDPTDQMFTNEFTGTWTMIGIPPIRATLDIVREGKVLHHLLVSTIQGGQTQPIFPYPYPVLETVKSIPFELIMGFEEIE